MYGCMAAGKNPWPRARAAA